MTDKELLEQFQLLAGMIQENTEEIKASETRIKVFIENEVSGKIKSLFDGYKSALENQAPIGACQQNSGQKAGRDGNPARCA